MSITVLFCDNCGEFQYNSSNTCVFCNSVKIISKDFFNYNTASEYINRIKREYTDRHNNIYTYCIKCGSTKLYINDNIYKCAVCSNIFKSDKLIKHRHLSKSEYMDTIYKISQEYIELYFKK